MKRYWKLLVVILVIVLGVGIFYGYQAVNAETALNLQLRDEEGRKTTELETGISFVTNESGNQSFSYQSGKIISEDDWSYFDSLNGVHYLSDQILKYQENYPSFMRGKSQNPDSFYETDTHLYYADSIYTYQGNQRTVEIARLDKASGEAEEWSVAVPVEHSNGYFYIERIYPAEDTLQLLAQQSSYSEDSNISDIGLYAFDFESEDLSYHQSIQRTEGERSVYLSFVQEMPDSTYGRFIPFEVMEINPYTGESQRDSSETLSIYDFETGETETLPLDAADASLANQLTKDETLYFYETAGDTFELSIYDMEAGEFSDSLFLLLDEYAEGFLDGTSLFVNEENHAYVYSERKTEGNPAYLLVYDLESEERLYAGEWILEEEQHGFYELVFYGLHTN